MSEMTDGRIGEAVRTSSAMLDGDEHSRARARLMDELISEVRRARREIADLEAWKKSAVDVGLRHMCSCDQGKYDCPLGKTVGDERCTADELAPELNRAREDSERIDWLEANQHMDDPIHHGPNLKQDLRAEIDAQRVRWDQRRGGRLTP